MSDPGNVAKGLRDRLGSGTEDRVGRALTELLESPLLTGAISAAFDARERAAQAQEAALGALNIPSAADIERLTRRLRSVSHRLEGIEDGVDRLDRALAPAVVEERLREIEAQIAGLAGKLDRAIDMLGALELLEAAELIETAALGDARPAGAAAGGSTRAAGAAKGRSKARSKGAAKAPAKGAAKAAAKGAAKAAAKATKAQSPARKGAAKGSKAGAGAKGA